MHPSNVNREADRNWRRFTDGNGLRGGGSLRVWVWLSALALCMLPCGLRGQTSQEPEAGKPGFVMEVTFSEAEVLSAVSDVAGDDVVRGTLVYDKEPILTGAVPAKTSNALGNWTGPGKVFYKVLTGAVAPRHFVNSADVGTITVRYVVEGLKESLTRVRIDAIFIEDYRRKQHASDGSVEAAEFKEIEGRLKHVEAIRQQTTAAVKRRQEQEAAMKILTSERESESARLAAAQNSIRDSEQRQQNLRRQAEMRVKSGGAELKSAPFHRAEKLETLRAGAEVVIEIDTPAWLGVETAGGRRGWMRRDELESLP
jgi:hypothetical protein